MIEISQAHTSALLAGTKGFLDDDPGGRARIRLYAGVRPAINGSPTGTLLAEIRLQQPCGAVNNGVLTLLADGDGLVLAAGTPTWARVVTASGATAWDCDVSDNNGSGEIKLESTTLYAGGSVRLSSAILA